MINLDEHKSIGAHWAASYENGNNESSSYDATYFDSFRFEHIPKEIKKFIGNKNIITNIEYKHTIRYCADTFVLNLLILC